jgi:hypothetical protein
VRCHLALWTVRGWYVAREALGPCDPFGDLPGATDIAAHERRDVIPGGGQELVIDVKLASTSRVPRTHSLHIEKRGVRALVVCATDPAPPRCTPPIPYACTSRRLADGPVDLLRRELGEPARVWPIAIRFPGDGTAVLAGADLRACGQHTLTGPLYLDL